MKLVNELLQVYEASVQDQVKKYLKDDDAVFELADKSHSAKSIAFSEKNKSWTGFSHRALTEFKKGDKLFDAKYTGDMDEQELEKLPYKQRGSIVIKTMEQAKQAAINFAEYVS